MENSVWRTLGPKGIMARVEGEGEKGLYQSNGFSSKGRQHCQVRSISPSLEGAEDSKGCASSDTLPPNLRTKNWSTEYQARRDLVTT